MEGGDIEIGDGVKPEDVSEEDAPIIKYVHSVIKDALKKKSLRYTYGTFGEKVSGKISD